tara:strand:- start:2752 stop:4833 length:2082 start_codon:yes stop_codon:yes gene_type:complete
MSQFTKEQSDTQHTVAKFKTTLHNDPQIYTLDNCITEEECNHLINIATPTLENSIVSDANGGYVSNGRTSKTSWVDHFHDSITTNIAKNMANIVGMPLENAEKFQVVYYGETNEYKQHYDSWDHNGSEKTLRCIKWGGPRMVTALLYLNKVEEGGSTKFTKLNIDVNPSIGKLLVFENTYKNSIDKHLLSEHAGMPVIKGEKYIVNLWFRQFNKSKLYSETNPSYYEKLAVSQSQKISIPQVFENVNLNTDIKTHHNFITSEESDNLINLCEFSTTGKYPNAWIKKQDHPHFIIKICSMCNLVPSYFENMNVIKYKSKEVHGPFLDAYDISTERGKQYTSKLGQRLQTISICLSESLCYNFNKINHSVEMTKGTLLSYKNVAETCQRNENMSHRLTNTSDNDGYILNIYIRQYDNEKNINPAFNLKTYEDNNKTIKVEQQTTESKIVELENYMETYDEVLNMFQSNKIFGSWGGYKSFKYAFKGDFTYFKKCVLDFKKLRGNNMGLNNDLLKTKYEFDEFHPVNLRNVIHPEMLELLKSYYKTTREMKVWPLGDKQSNRYKAHNEPFSRFLHYEILPIIEKITEKRLMPTYTYLSSYTKDSDLPPHTDRADCEYTVSFLVNKDVDWPIYCHKIKQPVKSKGRFWDEVSKEDCFELEGDMGGFIMFMGTDHVHFREVYSGSFYDILLLHYRVEE